MRAMRLVDGDIEFHGLVRICCGESSGAGMNATTDGAAAAAAQSAGVEPQLEIGVLGMGHRPGLRGGDDARLLGSPPLAASFRLARALTSMKATMTAVPPVDLRHGGCESVWRINLHDRRRPGRQPRAKGRDPRRRCRLCHPVGAQPSGFWRPCWRTSRPWSPSAPSGG